MECAACHPFPESRKDERKPQRGQRAWMSSWKEGNKTATERIIHITSRFELEAERAWGVAIELPEERSRFSRSYGLRIGNGSSSEKAGVSGS